LVGVQNSQVAESNTAESIFKDLPLIFREKGSGTRETMERFIASNDLTMLKKMELTSNEAVKQALIAGLAYSIMPLIGIKNELQQNELQIIPMKGLPITTTWSLIWLKGRKLPPVAEAFLDYLKEQKSKIVQEKFSWYEQYKKP
jgi:DNA-binding transcriptional LysR family regulator